MASLSSTIALATQPHTPATAGSPGNGQRESFSIAVQLAVRSSSASNDKRSWRSALGWTRSRAFGKSFSICVPYFPATAGAGFGQRSWRVTAFTPEQSKMVKDSWKQIQKLDAGHHALQFFLKVFEISPSVKRMFSFLQNTSVPIEKNSKLKIHALQVFVMTGQAAAQLGDKGAIEALVPKLLELGHTHVQYGVIDEHFDVVKFALLAQIAEALPESWTPELKEAWSLSYDEVVNNIKNEMEIVRRRESTAVPI